MGVDEIENITTRIQMQNLGEATVGKTAWSTKRHFTRKNKRILNEVSDFLVLIILH